MERAGQRGNIGKVTVKIASVPIVEHTVCRGRGDPASAERDNYIRGGDRIARNHDIADLLGVQRASPYAEGNVGTDRRAERAERVSVERMPAFSPLSTAAASVLPPASPAAIGMFF